MRIWHYMRAFYLSNRNAGEGKASIQRWREDIAGIAMFLTNAQIILVIDIIMANFAFMIVDLL